jgi:uncharacterized membrane protein YgdD (TMEM256/DUF423 family)
MTKYSILIGGIFAALAVGLGTYHAHGLEKLLLPIYEGDVALFEKRMGNWETAAQYQMYNAIGLILVGLTASIRPSKMLSVATVCFILGIILFSGLLSVLAVTNIKILGAIVPLGGLSMLVGWILLALGGCCLSTPQTIQIGEKTN